MKKAKHKSARAADAAFEEAAAIAAPSSQKLSDLGKLVNRAVNITNQIESLEEATKQLNIELYNIKSQQIPALMDSAGVPKFETDDGTKIELAEVLNGNIPKDDVKRAAALEWLKKNGGGGIIKTLLAVRYGKGQEKDADATRKMLKKAGIEFEDKDDVHFQTLCAFVRERVSRGKKVNYQILGLRAERVAKIKIPTKSEEPSEDM